MAESIREKDFLNGSEAKRKGSKVVKPVRSRTLSSKEAVSPSANDVSQSHGVASITQKAQEFVSSTYYKKEDLIVFDSDEEEDVPREPVPGKEATKSLAELEQLFFRCANVMKAEDIHLQMRNLHMIMAKQILKDMEFQIKYEEKKKASREMWDFKQKVHMNTFKRIAKPIEKSVEKKKREKDKAFFVPRWMPDERRLRCLLCKRPFGVFNRRHHCRACGDITCADCSKTEGPHRLRRCHECIRLNRTIAASMPPAQIKSSPPKPTAFSSTAGPSHPSHRRTTYIHQNSTPIHTGTTNGTSTPSVSSHTDSPITRDLRAASLPPIRTRHHTKERGGGGGAVTLANGTFSTAALAGPQNTSFTVPIAWTEGSKKRRDSADGGGSRTRDSSSSGSGRRSPPDTPLSSLKKDSSSISLSYPPKIDSPSTEVASENSSNSLTVSVAVTVNGTSATRPHAPSVSVVNGQVPWVPDEHRLCCVICGGTFHFFFRRHHCRKCGEVVCSTCSTVENTPDGERRCDTCRQESLGIA